MSAGHIFYTINWIAILARVTGVTQEGVGQAS